MAGVALLASLCAVAADDAPTESHGALPLELLDDPPTEDPRFTLTRASAVATIRVVVARDAALSLSARELVLTDDRAESLRIPARLAATARAGEVIVDGRASPSWEVRASDGPLTGGGIALLGRARLVAQGELVLLIDDVPLESYVASVAGAEMSASWPAAALQAQAVAARTYVLRKVLATQPGARFDVESTVAHQVYRGARSADPRTRAAAEATRGVVLSHAGSLAEIFFFANCVGTTETPEAVFGLAQPYLQPVACRGGDAAPRARWSVTLGWTQLATRLASVLGGAELKGLEIVERTTTGRAAQVRLDTSAGVRQLPATELRRLIGYSELPSTAIEVVVDAAGARFNGAGFGHGVGLCQWCARHDALEGRTYRQILNHYYPGASLERL